MNIRQGIRKAYETNWSMINTFRVEFQFGVNTYLENFLKINFDDSINLHIVSFSTPGFTNTPIESFLGNRWVIQNGRDELYQFSITFRDKERMVLYKSFFDLYRNTNEQYFDNCKFSIMVYKEPDNYSESEYKIMALNGVIVSGLSQLQFSNDTANQIAEFTVDFKCVSPNIF